MNLKDIEPALLLLHESITNEYLRDCVVEYESDSMNEYSNTDWKEARQSALEKIERDFEEFNNWICPSEFLTAGEYESAKKTIINYLGTI